MFNRFIFIEDGTVDIDELETAFKKAKDPTKIIVYRQGCQPPKLVEFKNDTSLVEKLKCFNESIRCLNVNARKQVNNQKPYACINGKIEAYSETLKLLFTLFPEVFGENNTKFND